MVLISVFIGGLFAANSLGPDPASITGSETGWFLGVLPPIVAMWTLAECALGTRPSFKFWVGGKPGMGSGWMAEGHGFARGEYALVSSLPSLCAALVANLYAALAPVGATGSMLLAVISVVWCAQGLWYRVLALLQPEGTLFEEHAEGSRLHLPT